MQKQNSGQHNPHGRTDRQPTTIKTDGGNCDDEPDWEALARREMSSTLVALLEMDVSESAHSIIHALGAGEPVDAEQLGTVRARFCELDERITHALREVGELDITTDAERLETYRRSIDHQFRRAARSARKDNLTADEIEHARESLRRADTLLDELDHKRGEDNGE